MMEAEADRECGLNDEAKESSRQYNSRQKLQTRAHILERSMFPILVLEKVRRTSSGDSWKLMESVLSLFLKGSGRICDKKNVIVSSVEFSDD